MPPAARVTDMHVCPMVTPGVPPIPHVGGPILPPGVPTVLIDFLPASTVTDMAMCVGPPDTIVMGSAGVFINNLPAARLGDPTAHGGVITLGSPTCIIGEIGSPSPGAAGAAAVLAGTAASSKDLQSFVASLLSSAVAAVKSLFPGQKSVDLAAWRADHEDAITQALVDQKTMLESRKADLEAWNPDTKAQARQWFGSDDEATRQTLLGRVNRELDLNQRMTVDNFYPGDPPSDNTFAYVYPTDTEHKIYLDGAFDSAPATGVDSKAGTLTHEMSHFNDVGGTVDNVYGRDGALALAQTDPAAALQNADSFEYFMESGSAPAPQSRGTKLP
jgi:uncharacterized Zn-binding protein involved in type VI secretion